MNIFTINKHLASGEINHPGLFPHLEQLEDAPFIFDISFGLDGLPTEPGILLIRGARQYGKSTWLESMLKKTILEHGAGTAFYLNGDVLLDQKALEQSIEELLLQFNDYTTIRRLFIDEITAIPKWETTLKLMADRGQLKNILVVTTGSNATDLRRGAERLPGRKGKLARTNYLFTPIAYKEFHRVCSSTLKEKTFIAYLLSGGSPIACSELASTGKIPDYVITLIRDWIDGEIARTGRTRQSLNNVLQVLFRFGGTPVGQAKLAREAALTSNTIAAGYIEKLNDLGVLVPAFPWDQHKNLPILRKPCKYHFTNLLVAIAYHPKRIRHLDDFSLLSNAEQGMWLEWLVAQELLRRSSISGEDILEPQKFWQNKTHEIDFVVSPKEFIEVKRGQTTAYEFGWFLRQFPNQYLTIINKNTFNKSQITGLTIEDFLLQKSTP